MSFVLLGILNSQASAVAQAYFLSVLGGSGRDNGESVAIDSADNICVFGETSSTGAGGDDFLLAKYNSSGSIQWQRVLGDSSNEFGYSVAFDSDNNVYVFGSNSSTEDFLLAKYDSLGNIQWQRALGGSSSEFAYSVAIDSADNVYVLGWTISTGAGSLDFLLAKYDSSGTIQWQRVLGGSGTEPGRSVAIDSDNNVYVAGQTSSTGAGDRALLLAKYDSSGNIQWQRVLGGADRESGYSVAFDSSNNVYVAGYTDSTGAGGDDLLLAKYDSLGNIQWQRVLGGSGSDSGNSIAIDSADNLYVLGETSSTGAGGDDFLLAKYNSSGSIQWQRVLGGFSSDFGNSIAIDSADNLCVFGETFNTFTASGDFLLAKLPNDGSLEGTYSLDGNNIIYQASNLSAATSSLTAATSFLTSSTSSLTSATSSLTDAAASRTVVTEEIG